MYFIKVSPDDYIKASPDRNATLLLIGALICAFDKAKCSVFHSMNTETAIRYV